MKIKLCIILAAMLMLCGCSLSGLTENRSSADTAQQTEVYPAVTAKATLSKPKEAPDPKNLGSGEFKVYLLVNVEINAFFSKYDVDVYADDIYCGTVRNSDISKDYYISMDKGVHTFKFYKSDDSSVCGEITETIREDTALSYFLKRHFNKIEVTLSMGI